MGIDDVDRYAHYMTVLANRDQALLVLAGLVLTAFLWYALLERWPRLRRWLAWAAVAVYVFSMAFFFFVGAPPS